MNRLLSHLCFICFCLIGVSLSGQEISNIRSKMVPVAGDTIQIDTLSLIRGSIFLIDPATGVKVDSSQYDLDPLHSLLIWRQKPAVDSVQIFYRVYPIHFYRMYSHKDTAIINHPQELLVDPFQYTPEQSADDIFDFGGLDYNGSFARGLSFGNNQDVVLNSSFNLQLSGMLSDDIELVAAMTDNNIPIQPEGNTQQIQDFDQVFIQVKKDRHQLTAGDFEILRPESHFMNFHKKLQGLSLTTGTQLNEQVDVSGGVSGAVSKGQYARNTIQGQEGNQGPYRLVGNNGETFIIVLAGTERVYVDGMPLVRGADNDYVIDYNAGEITFTPNILITKDSRIVVEFEYSVEYYFRTLLHAHNEWKTEKLNLNLNIYTEQDAKNQPILQEVDSAQRAVFAAVGDSTHQAFFPGYDTTNNPELLVKYILKDTTAAGVLYDSVFVYSQNPEGQQAYRVSFSNVGFGNGDYIISDIGVNGRVYQWVAPVNGIRQGNYAPIILLITPKNRQMVTLGGSYDFNDRQRFTGEIALSNEDVNLFSPVDDQDDKGLAFAGGYDHKFALNETRQTFITAAAHYEFKGENFSILEEYRDVEFTRDWNLDQLDNPVEEHLAGVTLGTSSLDFGTANYRFSTLIREGLYKGFRHQVLSNIRWNNWKLISTSSHLTSTSEATNTVFARPNLLISRTFPRLNNWEIGAAGEMEDNRFTLAGADSLSPLSFHHHQYRLFVQNPDTALNRFGADAVRRIDWLPLEGDFVTATTAHTFNVYGALARNPHNQLRWKLTYRDLNIDNSEVTTAEDDESILGRVEYNFAVKKGLIRSNVLYEVGSGQEQRREYAYLEVPAGQGSYIWNDDGDGVQELDEFEIASENDLIFANFIKVLTPTNEYIRSNVTQFNQSLQIDPKVIWRDAGGFRSVISKFSTVTSLQIGRKTLSDEFIQVINPFTIEIAEENLLSTNSLIRNTLYFNRSSTTFGAELNWQDARDKQVLTNGSESRRRSETTLRARWNLKRQFLVNFEAVKGFRQTLSEAFTNRNYSYDFYALEPEVIFQHSTVFRVSASYNFSLKDNRPEFGSELAHIHQLTTEVRYNVLTQSTLNARFSYATISFNGDAGSALGYSMLEGLQPGNNYIWSLGYDRKLSNHIQIGLSYDGRKSGSAAINHVGRAQLRALF